MIVDSQPGNEEQRKSEQREEELAANGGWLKLFLYPERVEWNIYSDCYVGEEPWAGTWPMALPGEVDVGRGAPAGLFHIFGNLW